MIVVESSGSQTASISTEHQLAAPTSTKTRLLVVSLQNMVAGDTVELRSYWLDAVSGTQRLTDLGTYTNAQTEIAVMSPPIPQPFGGKFTLTQTAGTGRAFPWWILTLD